MNRVHLPLTYIHDGTRHRVPIYYLYRYDAPVRECVLQAKVDRLLPALRIILNSVDDLVFAQPYDYIVAAPSSAWSRMTGRWDVGALLARELSTHLDVPLITAPSKFFWHWRKRSRACKVALPPAEVAVTQLRARLLMVDDIITTGATMSRLASHFLAEGMAIDGFTYALAGSFLDQKHL